MKALSLSACAVIFLTSACQTKSKAPIIDPFNSTDLSRTYECKFTEHPPVIDGRLNELTWTQIGWSEYFVDIEGPGRPRPRHNTLMKMAWDADYLYISAALEERHVWGTLTKHDEIVFHDNDFEVFLDPDGDGQNYFEIEINALGTIFDLMLVRNYRQGGPAVHEWNAKGLRSAVYVGGTLNNPNDHDMAWGVEMALPWSTIAEYCKTPCPPRSGQVMRMNFSRVEWQHEVVNGQYQKVPGLKEDNWVWRPTGVIDMHLPDRWGEVVFRQ